MGWRTVAGAGGHWQEGGPACRSHQQARACVCHPCRYAGPGWKGSGNGCAEQKISIRPFPVVPCLASAGPKGAKQKNPSLAKRASPFLAVFPAPGGWEKATVLVTSGWSPPATRVPADIRLPQLIRAHAALPNHWHPSSGSGFSSPATTVLPSSPQGHFPRLSLSLSALLQVMKALQPPPTAWGHATGQGFASLGTLGPSWLSRLCKPCSIPSPRGSTQQHQLLTHSLDSG